MKGDAPRQGSGPKPDHEVHDHEVHDHEVRKHEVRKHEVQKHEVQKHDVYEEVFRDVSRGAERAAAPSPGRAASRVSYLQRMLGLACVTLLIWLLFGKGSPFASTAPDGGADPAAAPGEIPRPWIASTSPAITETLWELGLAAHVVGRSPYCARVPKAVPVVGDLRDFDAERLALAAPDALFVQPPLAGVDPALRSFCEAKGIRLVEQRIDSLAETRALVDAVAEVFETQPKPGGAGLDGRLARADELFAALAADLPGGARETMPKALLLVSTEPYLAVGRGSYLDELLAAARLGNAVDRDGWVELAPEAIVAMRVDAILAIAETERGAAGIEQGIRQLPWMNGAPPPMAVGVVPELLTPSLVALRMRGALRELFERAVRVDADGTPVAPVEPAP